MLAEHCRDVGRDLDAITRSANYNVVIGRDEAEVEERFAWIEDHYRPVLGEAGARKRADEFRDQPAVGTPEQIVERLSALKDAGLAYAITYFAEAAYDTSGIELFEREVVPALR